jgi:hypothetical protein
MIWLAALLATVAALLPAAASARTLRRCNSADLRYPFMKGGPDDFGVFKLRITGGRCATAHRVAKAWQKRFEADIRRAGALTFPHHVRGFTFATPTVPEPQTFHVRGHRRATVIRFNYVVPNG